MTNFPEPNKPKAEKDKIEYGREYAEAMYSGHRGNYLYGTILSPTAMLRRRLYRLGEQPVDQYLSLYESSVKKAQENGIITKAYDGMGNPVGQHPDREKSIRNINFIPRSIGKQKLDSLVGRIARGGYNVYPEAIDPLSTFEKDSREASAVAIKAEMAMGLTGLFNGVTGTDTVPEELRAVSPDMEADEFQEVRNGLRKLDIEQAVKGATDMKLLNEGWSRKWRKVIDYCIEQGVSPVMIMRDRKKRSFLQVCDPLRSILDPDSEEDFGQSRFFGYRSLYTINDVKRLYDTSRLSESDLQAIEDRARSNGGFMGNDFQYLPFYGPFGANGLYEESSRTGVVEVLDFVCKQAINEDGDQVYETIYRGAWVVGTEIMLEWGEDDYVPHKWDQNRETFDPSAMLPVAVFATRISQGKIHSIVDQMIPHIDNYQLLAVKRAQFLIEAAPPGVAVNVHALAQVAWGADSGQYYDPIDLVKAAKKSGVYFYSFDPMMGNLQRPLEFMPSTMASDAIAELLRQQQLELAEMDLATGINSAITGTRDGENQQLVGLERMKLDASSNAFWIITHAIENTGRRVYEMVVRELQVFSQHGKLKEYLKGVSGITEAIFKRMDGVELRSFGFDFKFRDVIQDEQMFTEMALKALHIGQISVADYSELKEIEDPKTRIAKMRTIVRQREKQAHQNQMELVNEQNRGLQETNAQAKQLDMQMKMQEAQLKIQVAQAEAQIAIQKEQAIHQMRMEELAMKENATVQKEVVKYQGNQAMEAARQEGKRIEAIEKKDLELTKIEKMQKIDDIVGHGRQHD